MVCLTGLRASEYYQADLLEPEQSNASIELMKVIDQLNTGNQKTFSLLDHPKKLNGI